MYTKVVLTLMLAVLTALTLRMYSMPVGQVTAQTPSVVPLPFLPFQNFTGIMFLDPRTGRIFEYRLRAPTAASDKYLSTLIRWGTLTSLGEPILNK